MWNWNLYFLATFNISWNYKNIPDKNPLNSYILCDILVNNFGIQEEIIIELRMYFELKDEIL
jgi:hypothetical protein